jgi:hypothetical protein
MSMRITKNNAMTISIAVRQPTFGFGFGGDLMVDDGVVETVLTLVFVMFAGAGFGLSSTRALSAFLTAFLIFTLFNIL